MPDGDSPTPSGRSPVKARLDVSVGLLTAILALVGSLIGAIIGGWVSIQTTKSQENHADAQAQAATIQARAGTMLSTEYQMFRYSFQNTNHNDDSKLQSLVITLMAESTSLTLATTNIHMTLDVLTNVNDALGMADDSTTSAPPKQAGDDAAAFVASVQRVEHDINPTLPDVANKFLIPPSTTTTSTTH